VTVAVQHPFRACILQTKQREMLVRMETRHPKPNSMEMETTGRREREDTHTGPTHRLRRARPRSIRLPGRRMLELATGRRGQFRRSTCNAPTNRSVPFPGGEKRGRGHARSFSETFLSPAPPVLSVAARGTRRAAASGALGLGWWPGPPEE
jgi:hypothetical protein